jgi:hypothetical protein
MHNDSYLPGCLTAAFGLLRQRSTSPRVCVVTEEISDGARRALLRLYDRVVEVEKVPIPGPRHPGTSTPRTGSARVLDAALTRFTSLRLGPDGDLGCSFDKVVVLDADLLPLRDFDSLWTLPAPAGIINERRDHMVEMDRAGRVVVRAESLHTGEWVWHDVYGATCPHGARIPQEITDRVSVDHDNYGVNASLIVVSPSVSEYGRFVRWAAGEKVNDLLRHHWRWSDQQAATLFWSGRWTSIDPSFSTFYGYPSTDTARGLHFAGVKPWSWRKKGFARRLHRFPDYALWSDLFVEMVERFPALRELTGLRRLEREIRNARHVIPPPSKSVHARVGPPTLMRT